MTAKLDRELRLIFNLETRMSWDLSLAPYDVDLAKLPGLDSNDTL